MAEYDFPCTCGDACDDHNIYGACTQCDECYFYVADTTAVLE